MLKKDFLVHFRPPTEEDWIEASAGRAAMLRLSGPQGNLAIITVYLHQGGDGQNHQATGGSADGDHRRLELRAGGE